MIENSLSRFKPKEGKMKLSFGPVSVDIDARVYRNILMWPIQDTESNLRLAKESGIKPLSLREVFEQVEPETLRNTVLFDTPPIGGFAGNHWRVIEIGKEKDSATLQLCDTFGNLDYDVVPPLNVPLDTSIFTGVSIQKFELGGLPASLRETVKAVEEGRKQGTLDYPKSLKHIGETILWSNSEGKLVTTSKHPVL